MFQLLPCSNCKRTFSLREDVADQALLKCPNCGNQFRLGDVLDAFYARWIVLNKSATTNPTSESLTTSASWQADEVAERTELSPHTTPIVDDSLTTEPEEAAFDNALELVEGELTEAQPTGTEDHGGGQNVFAAPDARELFLDQLDDVSQDIDPSQVTLAEAHEMNSAAHPTGSHTVASRSRHRRAESGGFWSVLQVLLGGAAAIPVTVLLLWYVVGKDVLNAGPVVGRYVPWIVPQKFRGGMSAEPPRGDGPRVAPPAPGASGFRNFDDVLPMDGDRLAAPAGDAVAPASGGQSTDTLVPDTLMPELFRLASNAKEKIAQWRTDAEQEEKKTNIVALLDDFSALAERLSEAPQGGGAVKLLNNDIRSLVRSIVAIADLESFFKSVVNAQFNGVVPRSGPGRVYLGTSGKVEDQGDKWQLTQKEATYTLVTEIPKSVASRLEEQQKLFVLGKLTPVQPTSDAGSGAPKVVHMQACYLQVLYPPVQ